MKNLVVIVLFALYCFGGDLVEQDLKNCKIIDSNEAFEYTTKLCKGIGKYTLIIDNDDLRENLTIINSDGMGFSLDLWRVFIGFSKIEKIVWSTHENKNDILKITYLTFKDEVKKHHKIDIVIYPDKVCFLDNCIRGKKMLGKITHLVSGDRGCYITVDDTKGILAEYEICDNPNSLNKNGYFRYTPISVLSKECEGDIDCKKYENVDVISKVIELHQEKSCEILLFSCTDKKNKVTLCKSPKKNSYLLSYNNNSLIFTKKQLKGNSTAYSGGGAAWLNLDGKFILYTGIGKWDKNGSLVEKQGVVGDRNLQCSRLLKSEIGPQWFEAEKIAVDEREFILP